MPKVAQLDNAGNMDVKLDVTDMPDALSFDGVDDYIDTNFTSEKQNQLTMECWVMSYDWSKEQAVFGSQDPDNGHVLFWQADGGIDFYMGAAESSNRPNTGPLENNKWYHISGTVSIADNGNAYLYVNGELVNTATTQYTHFKFFNLPIGDLRDGDGTLRKSQLYGELKNVCIWDIARTQQEIQDTMNKQLNGDEAGLVGYWRMDDGTGDTVTDYTSNGNDGTINGATWTYANEGITLNPYKLQAMEITDMPDALDFDGVDDYVETSNQIYIGTSDWTVESWLNPQATDGYLHVFTSSDSQDNFACKITNGGDLKPYFYSNLGRTQSDSSSKSLVTNKWQHLAYVYNGSSVKIYLDGILVVDESVSGLDAPSSLFRIQGGNSEFLSSLHKDVRLWDTARTQQEIQDNMHKQLSGDESGLVVYWKLNEGTGNIAKDSTNNGNDGNINGATWEYSNDAPMYMTQDGRIIVKGDVEEVDSL